MSPLAEHLECYLAIRRGLGFQLGTAARILRRFVTFAGTQGADHITTALFLKWKDTFGQASRQTWAARLGAVRLFAQWLNGVDPRNEVPPLRLMRANLRRLIVGAVSPHRVENASESSGQRDDRDLFAASTFDRLFSAAQ